jgi:hypothetical protein
LVTGQRLLNLAWIVSESRVIGSGIYQL